MTIHEEGINHIIPFLEADGFLRNSVETNEFKSFLLEGETQVWLSNGDMQIEFNRDMQGNYVSHVPQDDECLLVDVLNSILFSFAQ